MQHYNFSEHFGEWTPSLKNKYDVMIIEFVTLIQYQLAFTQGSKLTFLLGSTGAPNFKKLGAPQLF